LKSALRRQLHRHFDVGGRVRHLQLLSPTEVSAASIYM
jgi:hypothetical protein